MSPAIAAQDLISRYANQTFSKNSRLIPPIHEKLFEERPYYQKRDP
jgi:hypothetical protein